MARHVLKTVPVAEHGKMGATEQVEAYIKPFWAHPSLSCIAMSKSDSSRTGDLTHMGGTGGD